MSEMIEVPPSSGVCAVGGASLHAKISCHFERATPVRPSSTCSGGSSGSDSSMNTTSSVRTVLGQRQLCKCSSPNVDYVLMASAATRRGQALLKPAFDWETDSFTAVAQCCRETTSPTCSGG